MIAFKPKNSQADNPAMALPVNQDAAVDEMLAAALRGELRTWPLAYGDQNRSDLVVDRAIYHGIAGLLIERRGALADWPESVITPLLQQARVQAMWEMRHRIVISDLLAAFKGEGIVAVLLKGTALAYDLYASPATRARGDTDLLIESASLKLARQLFEANEFDRLTLGAGPFGDFHLQEVWQYKNSDGMQHNVDLHWQTMNAPALEGLVSFAECRADPIKLPRLCAEASTMDRATMLLHLCLHRAAHVINPYYVDGVAYYGGDRLIWAQDIHLVAGTLADDGWKAFCESAERGGVAGLCLEALNLSQARLGTGIPCSVLERLKAAPQASGASNYMLNSGPIGRTVSDLKALPGIGRKLAFIGSRLLPSQVFMRTKYPELGRFPLPILYVWRIVRFLTMRAERNDR
jgi:hypothetical protein